MSLARRLLWESIRVVESSDWSCLYIEDLESGENAESSLAPLEQVKSQIAAGEISSHHAAQSVYVPKSKAEKRAEAEFDLGVLRNQAALVKEALLGLGQAEQAQSSPIKIVPVDLNQAQVLHRLAMKRACTFERYFCPERSCDVDFTRLDALLRHCQNSHGEGKKKKEAEREKAKKDRMRIKSKGVKGRNDKGKGRKKRDHHSDEDWLDEESDDDDANE